MQDFRKLNVWQKSHKITLDVYAETAKFPAGRGWALESQLTRDSLGSACELEYHLLLARDLGFFPERAFEGLASKVVEVTRMLSGLIRKLTNDSEAER